MNTYKCKNCGNEYQESVAKSVCDCCESNIFFIDLASYNQLNNHIKILEETIVSKNTTIKKLGETISSKSVDDDKNKPLHQIEELTRENKEIKQNLVKIQKENTNLQQQEQINHITNRRYINILSWTIILSVGIITTGGYWAFDNINKMTQSNRSLYSELQTIRQNLESDKQQLEQDTKSLKTEKTSLENEINKFQSEQDSLKNTVQNNHRLLILNKGRTWYFTGQLSLADRTFITSPIIIAKDSYINITLSNLTQGGDADFELFSYNGSAVKDSRQTKVGEDSINNFYVNAGSYYVKVWLSGNQSTSYRLKFYRD